MNNKINIEEIMMLLPDYITGNISNSDKNLVQNALKDSDELNALYNQMKGALNFAQSVKHSEPAPQYWNSLLPRIHNRIEEKKENGFSWEKLSALWKVVLPVAAIILIAIIYYIIKPSDIQLTDDKKSDEKKIEKIQNDSAELYKKTINNEKEELAQDDKKTNKIGNKENKQFKQQNNKMVKKYLPKNNENILKEDKSVQDEEIQSPDITNNDQLADDIDLESESIFNGESAGLDEDTENELSKLNNKEQYELLNELKEVNL